MKNKKEEKAPILYQKYRQENEKQEIRIPLQTRKPFVEKAADFFMIIILAGMLFLAAIGTITLLNPEMKMLLLEYAGGFKV